MSIKTKDRYGWPRAPHKTINTVFDAIALASQIITMIVALTLWGSIPYRVAERLIRRGGLRND